ncbi:tRNA (adenosine(37)-N6)-threonylcarbamoyltransferase complex dimerization subunit type 1 TsaB [Alkaliphilus serpentinus]|uniref:tRNA (Adenosine(37)-N6)-threonylcarbamoyltransferase complex dimerization subunit type 1 TsaB n=1 Tax=Alkaliphilus serpentinus TaxID=1482731 RepID=A0A833HQL2_9FIRM|nr:tRNA (adenosine(37)-N6)-threonylcarbamoyltransferase complex dimerization subunit type 1 TsaB [Alkaliphilus serpentinus]KAB3532065.1 tRNA (adenosine(37)-N6)-threonylcarbamoyltransferase complex dimerization subunit type 1 TsaB [Alkaliphilus serpentinus]
MKLLALDTSSMVATVAIMEEDKLIAETVLNHKKTHSSQLMPLIKEALDNCGLTPADIDYFAASLGPGSFTGLRIGITTIKAMAQALNKPVVGVSTLDALAYNLPCSEGILCPIIDAQRDNLYTARYKWKKQELNRISDYDILHIDELIDVLNNQNEKIIFLGDGINQFQQILEGSLKEKALFPHNALSIPRASSIGGLALIQIKEGNVQKAEELLPIYMRKSQAEKQFEERMREK